MGNIGVYLALLAFLDANLHIAGIVVLAIVRIAVHFFVKVDSVTLLFGSLCSRC